MRQQIRKTMKALNSTETRMQEALKRLQVAKNALREADEAFNEYESAFAIAPTKEHYVGMDEDEITQPYFNAAIAYNKIKNG